MAKVGIQEIKLYGYHGFFEEENLIGGWFVYDVEVEYDLDLKNLDDSLKKVIDYAEIFEIVKKVNAKPRKLIETLAFDIKQKITKKFGQIDSKIRVTKLNPPLGGDVGATFFEY